ncbi:MAG: branched-chain amino acid ABC transporter permease [Chloroflexi bacterium]|nr:MAG: branched-chain amino acid ABC transporter permease [Chloroflexota bacterium]
MSQTGRTKEFITGMQDEMPILFGVIPFGMIYGALALDAGLSPVEAQSMSWIIFGGSAQFISTQLFEVGAPGFVIIFTAAVVNLRHALYSASVAPYLQKLSSRWKFILAYLLTDEAYAVAINRYYREHDPVCCSQYYFLGAGLLLWTSWQLSTLAGILLGTVVPESLSLDFSLALIFIALMIPLLKDKPSLASAISAGITALFTFSLPYKLGLILAAMVGVIVGMILESRT